MRTFAAWIAVSSMGAPAPGVGYAFTKAALRRAYGARCGGRTLEAGGYVAVRVRVEVG